MDHPRRGLQLDGGQQPDEPDQRPGPADPADFTYADRQSENKPEEFLAYITDPASRQTLTVSYYAKGEDYSYIDSNGTLQQASNLTNPAIIDQIKSVTDISGRTLDFYCTTQGLLARLVDGAGDPAAKTFNFGYDATQGMKNVKLVSVQDPRGHTTGIGCYDPPTQPAFHWWTQQVTDRLNHQTGFAYTQPGGIANAATQTTVTNANSHAWTYQLDSTGRLNQAVNPSSQKTSLAWDADNNVATLTEDNGAVTAWTYDPNTGYPLTQKDAQANHDNTAATTFSYQTSLKAGTSPTSPTRSARTGPPGRASHRPANTARARQEKSMSKRVWLITGAGRGMGTDIAKAALAAGKAVVATGGDPERAAAAIGAHDDLLAVKLDVTNPDDAKAAAQTAVDKFGRIDVLGRR